MRNDNAKNIASHVIWLLLQGMSTLLALHIVFPYLKGTPRHDWHKDAEASGMQMVLMVVFCLLVNAIQEITQDISLLRQTDLSPVTLRDNSNGLQKLAYWFGGGLTTFAASFALLQLVDEHRRWDESLESSGVQMMIIGIFFALSSIPLAKLCSPACDNRLSRVLSVFCPSDWYTRLEGDSTERTTATPTATG